LFHRASPAKKEKEKKILSDFFLFGGVGDAFVKFSNVYHEKIPPFLQDLQ